jgi:hypothetical protein
VINEHWPYYAYDWLKDNDWRVQKMGRLYFRLANWRQPKNMLTDDYRHYWQAGYQKTRFAESIDTVELARIDVDDWTAWEQMAEKCNDKSVIVVENISNNWQQWKKMANDKRVNSVFDLYYCGILLFDRRSHKHHYKINF